ncbi:glycosyltransferase family 2 protein [Cognatiyoonia sp. IB215182]|uniref:glycosyltransferase n=1 Tax=Cognatiyoonia sp. IB215182 TaxID=3097353 RepID=UPI002A164A6F|nr:glycosyltransferase family 2 protein [Cognatiyoonia sp. IB215182]MDX8355009.1 glycosyltransferase family 2 protein [Cognatiyoonia sp. IB215182]
MTQTLEICVCTYRRPQLAATLTSLMGLERPSGYALSILVVDNDDHPSAAEMVETMATDAPIPLRYVHCPEGNISIARNGALAHSASRFLAFIDDDEVAPADWLLHLTREMEKTGADVVLGPVEADYADGAPDWMRRTRIHATMPVWVDNRIITGYTCNVLIDRQKPVLRDRLFDLSLGQTGGEDTAFFAKVVAEGGTIAFSPDALLRETIPPNRVSFKWLLRRRFRMGQTHGRLVAENGASFRLWTITVGKVVYCAGATVLQVFWQDRRNKAILRGALHLGALSGLAGGRGLQQYGPEFTQRQSE